MAISDFPKMILPQKGKKTEFFLITFSKIHNFHFSTVQCVIVHMCYMPGQLTCKFQVHTYIYFWQTYSPKPVFVDDVIFSNCDFEHFYMSHINKKENEKRKKRNMKNDIFGILRPKWFRNTHLLFQYISSKIWPFWPGLDMTLPCRWLVWGQIAKWLRFLNSTCKSD